MLLRSAATVHGPSGTCAPQSASATRLAERGSMAGCAADGAAACTFRWTGVQAAQQPPRQAARDAKAGRQTQALQEATGPAPHLQQLRLAGLHIQPRLAGNLVGLAHVRIKHLRAVCAHQARVVGGWFVGGGEGSWALPPRGAGLRAQAAAGAGQPATQRRPCGQSAEAWVTPCTATWLTPR